MRLKRLPIGMRSMFLAVASAAQRGMLLKEIRDQSRQIERERAEHVEIANRMAIIRPVVEAPVTGIHRWTDYSKHDCREVVDIGTADGKAQRHYISQEIIQRSKARKP